MAAARQNEMNDSMTEVATTTLVVRPPPVGAVVSIDWEGNRFSLRTTA
jgi:hypothetical protein